MEDKVECGADKAGRRVDFLAEQHRRLIGQCVAQNSAHNRAEHPHDGSDLRPHPDTQCLFNAEDREERNSKGIKKQKSAPQLDQVTVKDVSHDHPGKDGVQVMNVCNPGEGVASQQYIAQASATDGRNKTGKTGTEKVIMPITDHKGPGNGKEKGPQKFQAIL